MLVSPLCPPRTVEFLPILGTLHLLLQQPVLKGLKTREVEGTFTHCQVFPPTQQALGPEPGLKFPT